MAQEQKSTPYFSEADTTKIKKFLAGGLAIGGAAGLLTTAIRALKNARRLNSVDTSSNDDTLYIRVNNDLNKSADIIKKASDSGSTSLLAGGLGLFGGVTAAAGMYALIRKIGVAIERKKAQKAVDDAQVAMLQAQGFNKVKNPLALQKAAADEGRPSSALEMLMALGVASPILLGTASAIISNYALKKAYPNYKKPVVQPKRIVVLGPNDPNPDQEYIDKQSSVVEGITDDDGLTLVAMNLTLDKCATSDVSNLIHSVATEGMTVFERNMAQVGFFDAVQLTKGASAREISPLALAVATRQLVKSSACSVQMQALIGAEYIDRYPNFARTASELKEDVAEEIVKFANILGMATLLEIADSSMEKEAADILGQMQNKVVKTLTNPEAPQEGEAGSALSSSVEDNHIGSPGEVAEASKQKPYTIIGKNVRWSKDKEDAIDRMLSL